MKRLPSRFFSRGRVFQLARVGLVASLLLSIPSPQTVSSTTIARPDIQDVRRIAGMPSLSWADDQDADGMWQLQADSGANDSAGLFAVARTLPIASDVVGYRGPTEALIVFDSNLKIAAVGILSSSDTAEHVEAIRRDEPYFAQFVGWTFGDPSTNVFIDGVSGATLTSMALAEGVIRRIGGDRPSLLFPDDISDAEHAQLSLTNGQRPRGSTTLVRTGPVADQIIGYQGPTELLMTVAENDRVEHIAIRRSYDNEPYVDYVRTERGFWDLFRGRSLGELAAMDLQSEGVEGVSGATMTSMAVAETIIAASSKLGETVSDGARRETSPLIRWTSADVVTITMVMLAGLFRWTGLVRSRWARRVWLIAVVITIGFWAGNLISLALIAGWSANGIAWRLAPGLASIAAVALLVPAAAKANPYCNHLCPHGAVQQLLRPKRASRRRFQVTRIQSRWAGRIPAFILVVAYLAIVMKPRIDLASWEPFHAYLLRIAGWGSLAIAVVSLIVASTIPMAYCRFGCPTGRLIGYLQLRATSGRVTTADAVGLAMLASAWLIRGVGGSVS